MLPTKELQLFTLEKIPTMRCTSTRNKASIRSSANTQMYLQRADLKALVDEESLAACYIERIDLIFRLAPTYQLTFKSVVLLYPVRCITCGVTHLMI